MIHDGSGPLNGQPRPIKSPSDNPRDSGYSVPAGLVNQSVSPKSETVTR